MGCSNEFGQPKRIGEEVDSPCLTAHRDRPTHQAETGDECCVCQGRIREVIRIRQHYPEEDMLAQVSIRDQAGS
jgi:hypothetical protein